MNGLRCAWLRVLLSATVLFASAELFAEFDEDQRIDSISYDESGLSLVLKGEKGEDVLIEVSSELVDWEAIALLSFDSESEVYEDENAVIGSRRFFRAYGVTRTDPVSKVTPTEKQVLAGDTVVFIIDPDGMEGEWTLKVEDVENGNAVVGSTVRNESDPLVFFYRAPAIENTQTFTITATNKDDPGVVLTSMVEVVGIGISGGEIVIQPGIEIVPLGRRAQFIAGIDSPTLGFLPFTRGYWKVNGELSGNEMVGGVNEDGLYTAPVSMPQVLPRSITLGFSTTHAGAILAEAEITLVLLEVEPSSVTVIKQGTVKIPIASRLIFSDGSVEEDINGQLDFTSDTSAVSASTTRFSDELSIFGLGEGTVIARHKDYDLYDVIKVESRPCVLVTQPEVEILTDDFVNHTFRNLYSSTSQPLEQILPADQWVFRNNIPFDYNNHHLMAIEVTTPGVICNVIPKTFFTSSTRKGEIDKYKLSRTTWEHLEGINQHISFSGDESAVFDYDQNKGSLQANGITAKIDQYRGQLEFGNVPGTGIVTISYDDGYVQDSATLQVTFSRLEMEVEIEASISKFLESAYISESMLFTVNLTNPNSEFMGRTPLRISMEDNEEFVISYALDRQANASAAGGRKEKTREIILYAKQSDRVTEERLGGISFSIYPQRTGSHIFNIEIANDAVVNEIVNFEVVLPELELSGSAECILLNATNAIEYKTSHVPVSTLLGNGDHSNWKVEFPDGAIKTIPLTQNAPLAIPFRQLGVYKITHLLDGNEIVKSKTLEIQVIGAGAELPINILPDGFGGEIAEGNQLAAILFESPIIGSWLPGEPIDIVLQCYDPNGNPKAIGRSVRTTYNSSTEPGNPTILESHSVYGVLFNSFSGIVSGTGIPDFSGKIQATLTPYENSNPNFDLLVTASVKLYSPEKFEGLPTKQIVYLDNELQSETPATVFSETSYVNFAHDTKMLSPKMSIPGRGIVLRPAQIPVITARARNLIEKKGLDASNAYATVHILGAPAFDDALASSNPVVDLGDGITIIEQTVEDGKLVLVLDTDLEAFENDESLFGDRTVTVSLGGNLVMETQLSLFQTKVVPDQWIVDNNIPLNATYDSRYPIGSSSFEFSSTGSFIPNFELELRPSIFAVWDCDGNGILDAEEDASSSIPCAEAVPPNFRFRDAFAKNPILGFRCSRNTETNALELRQFTQTVDEGNSFHIFGNTTDRRRLDTSTQLLGIDVDPDGLPDFVSREADAELLFVRANGNLVDCFSFTAYNFVAEAQDELMTQGSQARFSNPSDFDFEELRNKPIHDVYAAYSSLNPASTIESVIGGSLRSKLSVWVDHEADPWAIDQSTNFIDDGYTPFQYYGGILDQYYQRRLRGGGFGNLTTDAPLRTKERIRPFVELSTGGTRYPFGIDLDGILYDPGFIKFSKPHIFDILGLRAILLQRLDEDPNSEEILKIPVVRGAMGGSIQLSLDSLVPRMGGSSGGSMLMDTGRPGRVSVVSKTPGIAFPGLHSGYLIWGGPNDMIDPRNSLLEDDIRDVIIKRPFGPNPLNKDAIQRENRFAGTVAPRRVMGFASNDDNKGPILTGARTDIDFLITTDPKDITRLDPARLKFKSILRISEKKSDSIERINLITTSQSEGDEKTQKLLLDAAVDLAVDLASTAILSVMTGGSYLEACSADVVGTIASAGSSLVIGLIEHEIAEETPNYRRNRAISFVNDSINTGFKTPIPGVSTPSIKSFITTDLTKTEIAEGNFFTKRFRVRAPKIVVTPCTLLAQPFDALKTEIKSTYSAESFGGLGASEASAVKLMAICIPKSAQLEEGLYSSYFTISRAITMQAKEPTEIKLSELPYTSIFGSYPFPDEVSDREFITALIEKSEEPETREDAIVILRALGRKSIRREMILEGAKEDENGDRESNPIYGDYKIRFWRMPGFEAVIGPGMRMGGGITEGIRETIGDFDLTPYETIIPVSTTAMTMASRSNENATAQAILETGGYEMTIQGAVIVYNE